MMEELEDTISLISTQLTQAQLQQYEMDKLTKIPLAVVQPVFDNLVDLCDQGIERAQPVPQNQFINLVTILFRMKRQVQCGEPSQVIPPPQSGASKSQVVDHASKESSSSNIGNLPISSTVNSQVSKLQVSNPQQNHQESMRQAEEVLRSSSVGNLANSASVRRNSPDRLNHSAIQGRQQSPQKFYYHLQLQYQKQEREKREFQQAFTLLLSANNSREVCQIMKKMSPLLRSLEKKQYGSKIQNVQLMMTKLWDLRAESLKVESDFTMKQVCEIQQMDFDMFRFYGEVVFGERYYGECTINWYSQLQKTKQSMERYKQAFENSRISRNTWIQTRNSLFNQGGREKDDFFQRLQGI